MSLSVTRSTCPHDCPDCCGLVVETDRGSLTGNGVVLRAQANTRAILIAGQPLNEPIAQYGPFVMNTREELVQAVDDFRAGLMG